MRASADLARSPKPEARNRNVTMRLEWPGAVRWRSIRGHDLSRPAPPEEQGSEQAADCGEHHAADQLEGEPDDDRQPAAPCPHALKGAPHPVRQVRGVLDEPFDHPG